MQQPRKKQKLTHQSSDEDELYIQLRNTIHASTTTLRSIHSNLKSYLSQQQQQQSICLCSVKNLLSNQQQQQQQRTNELLIGRLLPRQKTSVHVVSIFISQSEESTLDKQQIEDEIVCEVAAEDDLNLHLSYLNHWYLFTEYRFVPSDKIITYKPQNRKLPGASKFSYFEIELEPSKAICLLQLNTKEFEHVPFFPSIQQFTANMKFNNGVMRQANSKQYSIVGNVKSMCPIYSSQDVNSKEKHIQFVVKVIGQSLNSGHTGIVEDSSGSSEYLIIFSSKHNSMLACLYNFISVRQSYLFHNLQRAKVVTSNNSPNKLTTESITAVFMTTVQTFLLPIVTKENDMSSQISNRSFSTVFSDDNISEISDGEMNVEHAQTILINYEGTITSVNNLYTHATCQIDHSYTLYLTHFPMKNLGRGLRVGAVVQLYNVHPLLLPRDPLDQTQKHVLHGFGCCKSSTLHIKKFSPEDSKYRPFIHSIDKSELEANGQIMMHEKMLVNLPSLYPHYLLYLQLTEQLKRKFLQIFSEKQLVEGNIAKHVFDVCYKMDEASQHDSHPKNVYLEFSQHGNECCLISSYKPAYSDMNTNLPVTLTVNELKHWIDKQLQMRSFNETNSGDGWRIIDDIQPNWILLGCLTPVRNNSSSHPALYFSISDGTGDIPVQFLFNDWNQFQCDWSRYSKDVYLFQSFRIVYDSVLPKPSIFIQVLKLKLLLKVGHTDVVQNAAPAIDKITLKISFLSNWNAGTNEFTLKGLVLQSSDTAIRRKTIQLKCSASYSLGLLVLLLPDYIIELAGVQKNDSSYEIDDGTIVKIIESQNQLTSVRSILTSGVTEQSGYNTDVLVSVQGLVSRRKDLKKNQVSLLIRDVSTPDIIDVYLDINKISHGTIAGSIPNHTQVILHSMQKKKSMQSGKYYLTAVSGNSRIAQISCTKNQHIQLFSDVTAIRLLSLYDHTIRSQYVLFRVNNCSLIKIYKMIYRIGQSWCNMICLVDDGTQRVLLIVREAEILKTLFPTIDQQIQQQLTDEDEYPLSDHSHLISRKEVCSLKFNLYAKVVNFSQNQKNNIPARSDGRFHNPFIQKQILLQENSDSNHMRQNEKITITAQSVQVTMNIHQSALDVRDSMQAEVSSLLKNLTI
jgi:hypothetical protein